MLRDRMKSLFLHFSTKLKTVALFLGSSLIIFSFQNCGQASSDSEGENASTLDAKMSNVPFAYDVVLNQITVNGCDPTVTMKDDFMIRAGAYDDPAKYVGLGLRKEFTDYLLNNYGRREDPANLKSKMIVPQEIIQSVLQTSPKNAEASLVIGLTNAIDTEIEGASARGSTPLGSLSQTGIAQTVSGLQVGNYTSYFPNAQYVASSMPRIQRSIPMSLQSASSSQRGIAGFANDLTNRQVTLSAYFKDGETLATPLDSKGNFQPGKWYGRNYWLSFSSYPIGGGSFQMTGVEESIPSEKNQASALPSWTCAKYPVVDSEDAIGGVCPPGPITDAPTLASIRMLRRHLPSQLWDIRKTSANLLCLVPVKGVNSCYGSTEIVPPTVSNEVVKGSQCIVDGVLKDCDSAGQRLSLDFAGTASSLTEKKQCITTDGKIVRCMRYVSVCTRAAN
jgi:hypothetical protein